MTETPNTEMLVLGRESRGEPQSWLAEQSGIDPSRLSRIENGIVPIREAELERAAQALQYPIEFFYRDGGLVAPGTDSFHHRKKQSLRVTDRKRVHASLRLRRLELHALVHDVEINAHSGFQPVDLDDYDGNVERIADATRSFWGLPPGPILDLTGTIERCGGIVYHCRFDTNKLDALSQICSPLPALFFVNHAVPCDRMRWNLAHETGHLLMHHGLHPDAEREADGFAGAFLMPANDIVADLRPPITLAKLMDLKERWKVSISSLVMRARSLGVITPDQAKSLFVQMSKRGWRINEPGRFAPEKPALLRSILDLHRAEHGYSDDELAKRARLHTPEFLRLYSPGAGGLRLVS